LELVINMRGDVRTIYAEDIDLSAIGQVSVRRASHVEPSTQGGWMVELSPIGGPTFGPFAKRSEALAAEVAWLQAHWLTR
jgi:hypothetical protein